MVSPLAAPWQTSNWILNQIKKRRAKEVRDGFRNQR
jgi:hypothetical protein